MPEETSPLRRKLNLKERLENDFKYHAPQEGQVEIYTEIRDRAKDFALHLAETCPESRELSLALTKLEECVMFANASIARNTVTGE